MLPSGFGPESTAREAVMIDRTTLREQRIFHPPEKICIIVISCLSFKFSSIGNGVFLLITITVSGLIFNLFKRSKTVDPFSICISFSLFVLEIFTFIFTWIKTHIKNGLIKLLKTLSVAGVAKLGLKR